MHSVCLVKFCFVESGGFRDRLVSVAHRYSLCVVLIHVDDEAAVRNLPRINSQCLFHFCTLICVFSLLEVGLYLESVVSLSDRCMSQNISSTGSDFLRVSIILNGLKHVGKNDICSPPTKLSIRCPIYFEQMNPSSHRYLAWVIEKYSV